MTRIEFSLNKWSPSCLETGDFPASSSCRARLSRQGSSPFIDAEHRQHGKGPVGILRQATIASLGKAPQALQNQKRVLDLRAHTGLAPVRFRVRFSQRTGLVGTFVGEIFGFQRNLLEPLTLSLAPIGAVVVEVGLSAVQQVRVTALVLALHRRGCGNQRSIHNRTARELHTVDQQQLSYLGKQRRAQLVRFQQVPKVEQGHRIGHPLPPKNDPAELPEHGNIVERIVAGFVAQVEPVLATQYSAASVPGLRRPSIPRLRIMQFDQRTELGPRPQAFHACPKLRLARRLSVSLESGYRCQCYLFHRLTPCDENSSPDFMTNESFMTYSVFH